MSDLLVRDLPQGLKKQIEERAHAHGHSLSVEARLLIQRALLSEKVLNRPNTPEAGLGTKLAALGATLEPGDWSGDLIPPRDEEDRPPPDFS